MLSGTQIYAANQWAALSALAHDHDVVDWFHEAYSDLKTEKAAEEAEEAIEESSWRVRDFFEYNDDARREFHEYVDEGEREMESYDESSSLLDKLEVELRAHLGLQLDTLWPSGQDGKPSEATS